MNLKKTASGILAALILLAGCTGNDTNVTVPRRYAYPRINVYDKTYREYNDGRLSFEINSNATTDTDSITKEGARWLTLKYPRYKASLFLTATPVTGATLETVLDNRLERMALNVHTSDVRQIDPENPNGFTTMALYTPNGNTSTPVQFLASDSCRWVISGAVFIDDAATTGRSDSIKPVVDSLLEDVEHLLTTLKK